MSSATTGLGFVAASLTETERALVNDVRDFARAQRFAPSAESPTRGGFDRGFSARLAELGWVGMTIPTEYGGAARSSVERCLVISELLAAGAPLGAHWTADRQTAPSLLINGPESLRRELLPRIAAGRCLMAGGLSEPEAGSDLASVRTRAERVPGGWQISGRKIWTTDADRADYIEVLCRTADAPRKHEGLSLIVVPMNEPGIEVRPIEGMDGERHFNEVVLDGVFAPDGWLIGDEGSGWRQLTAELALERAGPERYLTTFPLFESFVSSRALSADPASSHELIGSVVAQQRGLREMSLSIARLVDHGGSPVAEAAMAKDLGTELEQLLVDQLWSYRTEPLDAGAAGERFAEFLDINRLRSAVFTTAGGTNEVLRILVARQLGGWADGRRSAVLRSQIAETVFDLSTDAYSTSSARSAPRGRPDPVSIQLVAGLLAAGFLGVAVPESLGGSGGDLADALDAVAGAAYAGVSAPLIDGPITAGWLLTAADIEFAWQSGLAVHAAGQLTVDSTGGVARLTGTVSPVSWGGQAQLLVLDVVHNGTVHVATIVAPGAAPDIAGIAGTPAIAAFDLYGEPAVHFVDTGLGPEQVSDALSLRAALARAVALSAALQRTAELTIRYAAQREQFGQPIDRFQAVQGHLTRLASEAQRAAVLVDAARVRAADCNVLAFGSVAAARVLTGEAAVVAARTAHQVHGAIGVTMEYVLQRYTRRLWEWSLADGGTGRWARELGVRACASDFAAWQLITDTDLAPEQSQS